jgi:hypothetical protein
MLGRSERIRIRSRAVLALAASVAALLTLTACANSPAPVAQSATPTTAVAAVSPTASATPSATVATSTAKAAAVPDAAQLGAQAQAAVQALIAGQPSGAVSVAITDTATGASFAAGATSGMWTASAYKLFVLETLLLRRQGSGGLTQSEQAEAVPMIEQSDNEDGYSLFEAAGGRSALTSAAKAFGMSNTVAGLTDPTFTTTSGLDYLALLRNLVVANGPLNATSQAYILNLMRHVESDQRWGVGVVADSGTTFANKNGWLSIDNENAQGEDDDGLWAVTSTGVVTVQGQQLLIAVFTQHQRSMAAGVSLVESLTKAMTPAVA